MRNEIADGEVVGCEVPGGEALVCAVEEREEFAGFAHFGDLFPLVRCWVDAGGVVGAGVKEDDGALRRGVQSREEAVVVEHFGLGREIWIVFDGEADVAEDLVVVRPGGV